jgi:hypothetical protein
MAMHLYLKMEDFNIHNIQFLDTKENTVMNGLFTKLIYSNSDLTMNGIFIVLPLQVQSLHKGILYFNHNQPSIENTIELERNILEYYADVYFKNTLTPIRCIESQLLQNSIKLSYNSPKAMQSSSSSSSGIYILKISGVWENATSFGLTFKFLHAL